MEYASYLLHLGQLVRCDWGLVCTVPSNFCRLVEELRATVGGKADGLVADLSSETCVSPPCIRDFALPNFRGDVHDPATRIW